MKQLNDAELNKKIESFMNRKLTEHPELQQPDGIRAGRLWHADMRLKEIWKTLDGSHRRRLRHAK